LVYQLVVFSHDQCNADMDHSKNVGKRLGGWCSSLVYFTRNCLRPL
jgi:hypothetical protein